MRKRIKGVFSEDDAVIYEDHLVMMDSRVGTGRIFVIGVDGPVNGVAIGAEGVRELRDALDAWMGEAVSG